jgi:hypothetical protein
MAHTIAVYEIDGLAYGGAEEGGWWYECSHLVRVLGQRDDEDAALSICCRYNGILHDMQSYLRPVSSMTYDGGRLYVTVVEGPPPVSYPERRPHYE